MSMPRASKWHVYIVLFNLCATWCVKRCRIAQSAFVCINIYQRQLSIVDQYAPLSGHVHIVAAKLTWRFSSWQMSRANQDWWQGLLASAFNATGISNTLYQQEINKPMYQLMNSQFLDKVCTSHSSQEMICYWQTRPIYTKSYPVAAR